MTRTVPIATGGVLAVAVLVGIVFLIVDRQGSDMTPQQAKQHVAGFVESTLSHAAPGKTANLKHPEGLRGTCHDRFGAVDDRTSRDYSWVIQDVDDALADQIVARTDQLWRERGLRVRQDHADPGVTTVIGSDEDRDFGYSLIANRNQHMVTVGGQTPCLDEDPAEAAGAAHLGPR